MSLKAKIEAVIYAAEEPVTLAQLTGLLSHEALAEVDRLTSAQHSLALDRGDPLNEEDLLTQGDLPVGGGSGDDDQLEQGVARVAADPLSELSEQEVSRSSRDEKERGRQAREFLRDLLDQLVRDYANADRGLEIREVAGGFRLGTKPEYHDAVRGFVKALKPPLKLTLQALETLAVVAYKQPVTSPEISEIRGVDSGGVLGSLMARKLVTTAGRKQVIGRPILYKTTRDFLLRFGLRDINELPSIEEFEKMAGELAEGELMQGEMPMEVEASEAETTFANDRDEGAIDSAIFEQQRDATEPQADGDGPTVETVPGGRTSGISPGPDAADGTDTSTQEAEEQGSGLDRARSFADER